MTTAEGIAKDIAAIKLVCDQITALSDVLDQQDAAKVAAFKSKADAALIELQRCAQFHRDMILKAERRKAAVSQ